MAEAPTRQGLLNSQSFGTIAPYEPNMVEKAQGLLAQGLMKFGYDPRDAYVQANKIINTQGGVGAADFTPIAGDFIGAQDAYDMGVDAKRAFDRDEYLKSLGYGAGSAATGILSGLGVLGTVAPPVDKAIDAARAGVKKATGLLDDVDELGFYSPTERLATNLQPKGTGQQYLGILSKGDGKGSRIQEEMQDMGLDTWLKSKGKVSRDEVLDYIGDNRLRYGEEVLTSGNPYPYRTGDEWQEAVLAAERRGDFDEAQRLTSAWESSEGYGTVGDAKYQQEYSQQGGTDYQENLLTVLKDRDWRPYANKQEWQKVIDDAADSGNFDLAHKIAQDKADVVNASYQSPHYDPENIGLTTRTQSFNTPQGDSVHLMDELQSDWHSDGRTRGYRDPDYNQKISELQAREDQLLDDYHNIGAAGVAAGSETPEQIRAWRNYMDAVEEKHGVLSELKAQHNSAPNAPAKQSWMNQGIKKEINQTIADGRDYFAWTGGDIQADRYGLRNQIDSITYEKRNNLTNIGIWDKDGDRVYRNSSATPEDLERELGKDMAEKILKGENTHSEGSVNYIIDADLKVGGEGMKSFYDKDVKKRTEKIIKRLDPNAKVEVIELDNGNKVWGVKITDKMRDKVKSEGMPLYSIAPIAGAGLLGAGMMQQEEQQPQQGLLN